MTDALAPLSFGGITLENNLLQAPLAGYSSLPFRLLSWRLGRPGLLATEMISAKALCFDLGRQEQYLRRSDREGPVAYQLWGADPEFIGKAAGLVTEAGADVVDLNCGCPVRKVRAAGAGSKLMENPPLIGRIVAAMRKGTDKPVTVKIRVGTHLENMNGAEVARIAEENGADLITVHGRHARERYATPVRLDEIRKVVEAVTIPVVGNGNVRDGESAHRMLAETGCVGLMIGRACMGAPWSFARLKAEIAGASYEPPALTEMGDVLLEHHDMLVDLYGAEKAIRHCRKLGSFYSKGVQGAKEFRNRLNYCHCRDDLAELVALYFKN